jgi:hypothetical protein
MPLAICACAPVWLKVALSVVTAPIQSSRSVIRPVFNPHQHAFIRAEPGDTAGP